MQMTQIVRKLGRNDIKLIGRDSFLVSMLLYIFIIAVVLRYALPWLDNYLVENGVLPNETITFGLTDIYPMIVAYLSIYIGAVLVGVIFGFMLLDEKDDNTLKAMLVTPISLNQYLLYRVGVPTVVAFFGVLGQMLIINQALVPLWQMLLIAAGAALTAPIAALFFATFAANKVQGFAMTKFVGVAGLTILLGWFVAEPLQFLIGLFPPFWVAKAYWMALEGRDLWLGALLIGVVTQVVLLWALTRRFNKVAYSA